MLGVGPLGPLGPARAPVPVGGAPITGTDGRPERPAGPVRGEPPSTIPGAGGGPGGGTGAGRGRRASRGPRDLAEERQAWVVLATVEGVGERTLQGLIATHGSARRALWLAAGGRLGRRLAAEADRRAVPLAARTVAAIEQVARDPGAALASLRDSNVWTVTLLDPDYPARLDGLAGPPPVLFGQGDPAVLHAPAMVAIVGTRRASPAGRFEASRAAATLVAGGVVVVSGLAVGIDGAAHAASVEGGGTTVAVIGSGHRRPGPRAHAGLVRRILERGAVIGELPPMARATHGTYPRRNRLIAALADAVVVIEAPVRSGALITARLAMEQGVPVYAAAGIGTSPLAAGCRALLSECTARPFDGIAALSADLGWSGPAASRPTDPAAPAADEAVAGGPLGGPERDVAAILAGGPATFDDVLARTGGAPGEVAAVLTLLQLRGLVRSVGPLYLPAGRLLVEPP